MYVEIEGAGELVRVLAKFNKQVYKTMTDEIREEMGESAKDIAAGIPSGNPLSNWGTWNDSATRRGASTVGAVTVSAYGGRDLGYDPVRVRRSIVHGARQSRIRRAGVVGVKGWAGVKDAGGSIFTTAGSMRGRGSTNSTFVRNLRRKFGNSTYPRVLARVWVQHQEEVGRQIDAALDRARQRARL